MKLWQYLALLSGAIIAGVMALASISYNATLGNHDPAFAYLPLTNRIVFSALALAFDLGMVASVFGFLHWRGHSRPAALVCAVLFVIASLYSIHSVRGYIALNITESHAPLKRAEDIYASIKLELGQAQEHLPRLRTALIGAKRSERKRLERQIVQLTSMIQETRTGLSHTNRGEYVAPITGLAWFLAVTLWFFNATCWAAWFGYKQRHPHAPHDTVREWLVHCDHTKPEHCAVLYRHYNSWCERHERLPLAQYNFYGRLIELGAKKFRDGRNGPTKYALP